jgi:DNA invertase Pin-like site-specific DNA recombinase
MDDAATSPAGSNLRAHASCAIYARTSRESEAGLTYSSIEAQQDACCAYLHKPQSLGQPAVPPYPVPPPHLYADEGLSGATLQHPALQHLLADIAAGLIDVVVVYKIDRLSRNLTQFSRLMQIFDRHSVQLLLVSQRLDSQHAEGRLVINTLMAFAQFARELTGERQLDKIRATRRHVRVAGRTKRSPRAATVFKLARFLARWPAAVGNGGDRQTRWRRDRNLMKSLQSRVRSDQISGNSTVSSMRRR